MPNVTDEQKMRRELAKIRQQEEEKKLQTELAQREASRADARAAANDKLAKEHMITDSQTGREITLWEANRLKVKSIKGADVMAYNDWRSAMSSLWNLYGTLNHAMTQSLKESIVVPVGNKVTDSVLLPLSDAVSNFFTGDPDVDIPALLYSASYTDDNKLKLEPLTRSDKVGETGELDDLFYEGLRTWLKENGYTVSPDDKFSFVDEHGNVLDKATFERLRDDPDHGLDSFLRRYTDLDLRPSGP